MPACHFPSFKVFFPFPFSTILQPQPNCNHDQTKHKHHPQGSRAMSPVVFAGAVRTATRMLLQDQALSPNGICNDNLRLTIGPHRMHDPGFSRPGSISVCHDGRGGHGLVGTWAAWAMAQHSLAGGACCRLGPYRTADRPWAWLLLLVFCCAPDRLSIHSARFPLYSTTARPRHATEAALALRQSRCWLPACPEPQRRALVARMQQVGECQRTRLPHKTSWDGKPALDPLKSIARRVYSIYQATVFDATSCREARRAADGQE